jgi:hypothetical protein
MRVTELIQYFKSVHDKVHYQCIAATVCSTECLSLLLDSCITCTICTKDIPLLLEPHLLQQGWPRLGTRFVLMIAAMQEQPSTAPAHDLSQVSLAASQAPKARLQRNCACAHTGTS